MPSMSSLAGLEGGKDAQPTGSLRRSIIGLCGTHSEASARVSGGFQPDRSETRDSGFLFAPLVCSDQAAPDRRYLAPVRG